jgi:beta-phosphoglucomutase-like phosphatase (HAD superfamily)
MGRFKAAVFDWAGTMIDFGSFAPMGVFVEAFRNSASRRPSPRRASRWGAQARPHQDDDGDAGDRRAMGALKRPCAGRGRYRRGLCRLRADERGGRREYATLVPGAAEMVA